MVKPLSAKIITELMTNCHEAAQFIGSILAPTPLIFSEQLSEVFGSEVWLKLETLQVSGSFKVRGALWAAENLRRAGTLKLVCYSSGNHALGVAWAAKRLGMQAIAVMPVWANKVKVKKVKALGAEVILYGTDSSMGLTYTEQLAVDQGGGFIHPFDSSLVICGQASIGLEILSQLPEAGLLVAPASGGGLISGLGAVVKEKGLVVYAVQPTGSDALARSVAKGRIETIKVNTRADALTAEAPSLRTVNLATHIVDRFILLDDYQLQYAAQFLLGEHHILAELGGAAAVAGILAERLPKNGEVVVAVVSGGNCSIEDIFPLRREERD